MRRRFSVATGRIKGFDVVVVALQSLSSRSPGSWLVGRPKKEATVSGLCHKFLMVRSDGSAGQVKRWVVVCGLVWHLGHRFWCSLGMILARYDCRKGL